MEEATAASQSMQGQAASLAQMVSVFKLDGGKAPARMGVRAGAASAPAALPKRLAA